MTPKNPHLKRTRLAAGSLLALMAVLYVVSRSYQESYPWLEWVKAFAEAGMVGGLADWFAVTALFRHPLGLPIPHTAVIPREKDRIGQALAKFVRGNFLTSERICKQIRELKLIHRVSVWLTRPDKAAQLAQRTLSAVPTGLDALEKNNVHHRISAKIIGQLREFDPANGLDKLIDWLLDGQRDRKVLAPLLAQMAHTLEANKEKIETAAGDKAPLSKIPLLGRVSRAVAEDFSSRTTGSIGERLLAASQNPDEPLWEVIEQQLVAAKNQLDMNDALRDQLQSILNTWLDDTANNEFGIKIWSQLRGSLEDDLETESPVTQEHLAHIIIAAGQALENDPEMAANIENILTDAIGQILDKHGEHLETMIRETIEEWDSNTLMLKLEQQVGPDLQFIRINGTLIGGLVGVTLHAVSMLFW